MNAYEWIDLQRTILFEVAETHVKSVQATLSRKGQSRMTEKGASLHAEDLRVRVRLHKDRYIVIEWLIRRWSKSGGQSRFTTRTLRKGRGFQTSRPSSKRKPSLPTVVSGCPA